jgi:O-antigen/teichoic acid export membrane protein
MIKSLNPRRSWRILLADRLRNFVSSGTSSIKLAKIGFSRSSVALADQALISGSNFLANIVLVRGLGLNGFGKYFLAYAVILYANAVQMSFVTAPMLTIAPMLDGEEKRSFLKGMLAIQVLASLLLLLLGVVAGVVIHHYTDYYSYQCILAVASAIGAFQAQDWIRRYYFLVNKKHLAVVSDCISYFAQLVILALLWRLNMLTLSRTFWTMSLTSLAAFLMGPLTDRILPSFNHLESTWKECRVLSRDLLVSNQVRWFGDQGILMIATGIVGPSGIGGLRATQSLAGPVSLVLTSLDNVLPLKIADILKAKGTPGAYRFTRSAMLFAAVGLGSLLVPVAVFGRPLLRLVYGPAVVAFYVPMLLQLVNIVVGIATRLWFYLYRGVRDTRAILRANFLCAMTSVATVYILGHFWGASGIVLTSLLGQVAIVAYCTLHWRRYRQELMARYPEPSEAPYDVTQIVPKLRIHDAAERS